MIVCNTVKTRQNINKGRIGSLEWKTTVASRLDGFQPVLSSHIGHFVGSGLKLKPTHKLKVN